MEEDGNFHDKLADLMMLRTDGEAALRKVLLEKSKKEVKLLEGMPIEKLNASVDKEGIENLQETIDTIVLKFRKSSEHIAKQDEDRILATVEKNVEDLKILQLLKNSELYKAYLDL